MGSNPEHHTDNFEISEEDESNVDLLLAAYPALAGMRDRLHRLFPDHDRLLAEVFIGDKPQGELTEIHLLLYGLTVRSRSLLSATLREILKDNKPAVTALLRAQCENLATASYIEKFPAKLQNVLFGTKRKGGAIEAPNILTQIEHADKKYPGLAKDYDQLSDLAHPTLVSHMASVQIMDEAERRLLLPSKGLLRPGEAETAASLIGLWTTWLLETTTSIRTRFVGDQEAPDPKSHETSET